MSRNRVAVVTTETLGQRLAGPAIRAWHIADELARHHDVRLVSTVAVADVSSSSFSVAAADPDEMAEHCRWADVVVAHPGALRTHPATRDGDHCVVVDIYDPFHLENLEPGVEPALGPRMDVVDHLTAVINDTLVRGDFFLCASERQRDFWLGSLAAIGRVNPATYDTDASLRRLIDVVPFGLPVDPPVKERKVLRGVLPGIGEGDLIVLWGGGIYNWFDPLTLIEAVDLVRHDLAGVRLIFMGTAHPNPALPEMQAAVAARARAAALGLTDRHVFFNEGWVPYDERGDYLLEADLGVSTHLDHIETAFSFRTRMLDYIWAGLPYVTSAGDVFAELAESEEVGAAVAPGDAEALASAMTELLVDPARRLACRERLGAIAPRFSWPVVLEPLQRYCAAPARAADHAVRSIPPVDLPDPPSLLDRALRRAARLARGPR